MYYYYSKCLYLASAAPCCRPWNSRHHQLTNPTAIISSTQARPRYCLPHAHVIEKNDISVLILPFLAAVRSREATPRCLDTRSGGILEAQHRLQIHRRGYGGWTHRQYPGVRCERERPCLLCDCTNMYLFKFTSMRPRLLPLLSLSFEDIV